LGSYGDLISNGERALDTELAILDINLGANAPSGLDCERWLRQSGYTGHVIFLTGHALTHPLVVQAVNAGSVEILEKPQGINRLIEIVSAGSAA
jgi:FixJ family two-component response regulator